jgi:Flp pilus assembly protein TadD
MGYPVLGTAMIVSALLLSACGEKFKSDREMAAIGVIDATDLNDIMLTVADPNEAVEYFRTAALKEPDRIEFRRGLAQSLVRAKRAAEAIPVFEKIIADERVTDQDRLNFADALIRTSAWKKAAVQLNSVPPTVETFQRYRLEALVADSQKKWKKADSFYEIAAGLTTKPAGVLNNWGFSKLTRGESEAAEKLFLEAITYDRKMFTAKNNLVLARAAQKNYSLPVLPMTSTERAQLLYTMGLAAIKQNDTEIGRGLLEEAIDTHPQYFEAAVRSLEALS